MKFIKVNLVYYKDGSYKKGDQIILNSDTIITIHKIDCDNIYKENDLGNLYTVNTTVDNCAYPLKLSGKYLDQLFESAFEG